MERMKVCGGGWPSDDSQKMLTLDAWMERDKIESVIIHPYNFKDCVEEILEVYRKGLKVIVIEGSANVREGEEEAYKIMREKGISTISKESIIGSGSKQFLDRLGGELSKLFNE